MLNRKHLVVILFIIIPFVLDLSCIIAHESYFGEWIVVQEIARNPIYALSNEEIESIIGKKVIYKTDVVIFGERICNQPKYDEECISDSEFFIENRLELRSLGINENTVKTITIWERDEVWVNPGGFFIVKNGNTLIMLWDGVYFELAKQN